MIRKLLAVFGIAALFGPAAGASDAINFDQGLDFSQVLRQVDAAAPSTLRRHDGEPADWTVMVFLNGKNNLAPYGYTNFKQMEKVGSTPNVNIVVEFGLISDSDVQGGWHGARRFLVKKSSNPDKITSPVLQSIANRDMGDWHNLVDFAKWAETKFPAKHTMLIVWNHGSGWTQHGRPDVTIRGISYDDETGHHITTEELGQALAAIGGVDVYASDACLMQMAEVDYEIMDHASTIVGSEETEPGDGYTYNTLLGPLVENPGMTAESLGKIAVQSYVAHYQGGSGEATQSAVRAADLKDLASLLDGWTAAIMNGNEKEAVVSVLSDVQKFYIRDNVDLYDFARLISERARSADVKSQARQVMQFLSDKLIVASDTAGSGMSHAKGLAIYLPSSEFNPDYADLAWAKGSRWMAFARWVSKLNARPKPAAALASSL
jgi:hypothetical protein